MIKSKFGQRLRGRTLTAQINEALCPVLRDSVDARTEHYAGVSGEGGVTESRRFLSRRRPIVSVRKAKTKTEVKIAERTSAPRNHVIAIIKTQTMSNTSK